MNWLKRTFSPQRQRVAWVVLTLLLQLALFVVLLYFFDQYFVYFYWFCLILSIGVSLYISTTRSRLAYKVAWIVPILLVPLVGGLLYLLLTGRKNSRGEDRQAHRTFEAQLIGDLTPGEIHTLPPDGAQVVRYLGNAGAFPACTGNLTCYYPTGEQFLPALLSELEKAKRYIFLEYFIINPGKLWDSILEILIRKAAEGVEVRVICDGIGSAATLPRGYSEKMRQKGISFEIFHPFLPVLAIHHNYRDHRKICVIDGVTGFLGGLNLADEYVGYIKRFGVWKDNALLLRGSAVWNLTVFFLSMWDFIRSERTDFEKFLPDPVPVYDSGSVLIPYVDSPLPEDTISADLYLQMIGKAKRYLYITTPYLVIDETITSALCIAARSGVDVRIMTPHIPDKKMVFTVTRSNYPELLSAGIRIFEFTPGFLHSKSMVTDDCCAVVGSCNMDYRSYYLQFENGVWLWEDPSVLSVRDDFLNTLALCQEITPNTLPRGPFRLPISVAICRLLSPLF